MASPTRNILLLLLSIAAGCVDAIAFVNAGVFPANMTGNSVVLAASLLHPKNSATLISAAVLLAFCVGAAGGAWVVHSADHQWSRCISFVLLAAGLIVLGCAIAVPLAGVHFLPAIIVISAVAMGLQSAAVQQLGVPGVATVFVTGTLTTAIGRSVGAVREKHDGQPTAKQSPWLPALSWLSYFFGAFLGGLQFALHTAIPIALPGVLLITVALLGLRSSEAGHAAESSA